MRASTSHSTTSTSRKRTVSHDEISTTMKFLETRSSIVYK